MKILYVKNNSERAKEFQLKTIIYEENGEKFVKKEALCEEAIPHLKKMKGSYNKLTASIIDPKIKLAKIIDEGEDSLTFEFIDGVSLEKRFNDALKLGNNASNEIIDDYMKLLKTGFRTTVFDCSTMIDDVYKQTFGDLDYSKLNGELCFDNIANIDLILSNIIFKDTDIYVIDYEWVYELSIPIDYIAFRALHNPDNLLEQMEKTFIGEVVVNKNGFHKIQTNYFNPRFNIVQQIQEKDQQIQEKDQQIQEKNQQIQEKDQNLNDLIQSKSWKLTNPLRQLSFVSKTLLKFNREKIDTPGTDEHRFIQAVKRRIPEKLFLSFNNIVNENTPRNQQIMPWSNLLTSISKDLGERVLIIAELSLPQCKKYRVDQKVEMLEYLGYEVSVLSWNEIQLCRQALQLHGMVIFYRVPGFQNVVELLNESKRLKIVTFFDVDDLIFDRELMIQNENIRKLKSQELEEILNGADLYQSVLSSVDHIISSTNTLGEQMKRYNDGDLYIIKNCLDDQLYNFATSHSIVKSQGDEVKIVYGSGTSTHDEDFLEVADALVQILQKYSNVKLYIHGILNLPSILDNFSEQVIKVPFSNADEYYRSLSSYDINIAPLETSIFNDAKSNLKFLEAAIFKTPTVASKAAEFVDVIENTKNGFLADNTQEWFNALELLVLDKELRNKIGERAYETALDQYSLELIATNFFKPLLDKYLPKKKKRRKKILMVNILFQPISFGGATIVVEELAHLLDAKEEFEITVFTGFWDAGGYPILECGLVRYEANGLPIIAVRFPPMTAELEYKNTQMENIFDDVLKTVQPDLVHFHSMQQLSASLAISCQKQSVLYTITLHDMWWLCEKQFMIMPNNKYCHQKKIDTEFCIKNCTHDTNMTKERTNFLKSILQKADLLLTPSVFQAEVYLHNELNPNKIKVNKNGIQFPSKDFKKTRNNKVRFTYLGGNAIHKGYNHIKEIFESITESNYELVLVDLHRKLGHDSIVESDWNINGQLTISNGYEYGQKGLDEFFSSIDVLLFPSQWKESFGLTIREALVRDVWVISTDAGGVVEDIAEGENGNVIAMTDDNAFQAKIEACLNKPYFFHAYTNPHKDQIRSYEEQADELVEYYNTFLD